LDDVIEFLVIDVCIGSVFGGDVGLKVLSKCDHGFGKIVVAAEFVCAWKDCQMSRQCCIELPMFLGRCDESSKDVKKN
jgi:hypothetical protein